MGTFSQMHFRQLFVQPSDQRSIDCSIWYNARLSRPRQPILPLPSLSSSLTSCIPSFPRDSPLSGLTTAGSLNHSSLVGLDHAPGFALLAVLLGCGISISVCSPPTGPNRNAVPGKTHRPLGKPEIGLSSTLGDEAFVVLQAPAHGAGSDGEVAVVARERKQGAAVSLGGLPRCGGGCYGQLNSRNTCGFPRERHFGG